jgi:hypothetical protein
MDCYQKGRELGSRRFIPPPDAVVRAMLDALLQRSCPTLTRQKSRPQSETFDIAGLGPAICTVARPSSAGIATRGLAGLGIWAASSKSAGILGLCLHHVGRALGGHFL